VIAVVKGESLPPRTLGFVSISWMPLALAEGPDPCPLPGAAPLSWDSVLSLISHNRS